MRRSVVVLVMLVAAIVGAVRAWNMDKVPGDFLRYHRAGRLVATGRADLLYDEAFRARQAVYAAERATGADPLPEGEFKYAPALAVMMAPLGALSPRPANAIWCAWNGALMAAMFLAIASWRPVGVSAWWMLVPIVVLLRPILDNFNNGQVNTTAIVPATIGVWLLARGRDRAAGALIGVGTAVKFMPGVLALWLAWKRKWTALATAVGVVAVLWVALPVVALGPSRALSTNEAWRDARAHHFTSADPDDLPGYSVKSFVYRVLGTTPYHESETKTTTVGSGVLSAKSLQMLTLAIDGLILAAALWLTRGASREAADARGPPEAALWLVTLPLVSPEARFPHFLVLALPVAALTHLLVADRAPSNRRSAALALGVVGAVLLNATSDKLFGHRLGLWAEIYCLPGWGALLVGAALAIVLRGPSTPLVSPSSSRSA